MKVNKFDFLYMKKQYCLRSKFVEHTIRIATSHNSYIQAQEILSITPYSSTSHKSNVATRLQEKKSSCAGVTIVWLVVLGTTTSGRAVSLVQL
jgi:hypothetical protein